MKTAQLLQLVFIFRVEKTAMQTQDCVKSSSHCDIFIGSSFSSRNCETFSLLPAAELLEFRLLVCCATWRKSAKRYARCLVLVYGVPKLFGTWTPICESVSPRTPISSCCNFSAQTAREDKPRKINELCKAHTFLASDKYVATDLEARIIVNQGQAINLVRGPL